MSKNKRGLSDAAACSQITYTLEVGDSYKKEIFVNAQGEFNSVGSLDAHIDNDDRFSVNLISVSQKFRRCGIATKLYEMAAKYACDNNMQLKSGVARSAMADGFWAKQVQKGRATCAKAIPKSEAEYAERRSRTDNGPLVGRRGCDHYVLSCPVTSLANASKKRRKK